MDLKRELKLSDLFRRRPKDAPAEAVEAASVAEAPADEQPARGRRRLFTRRRSASDAAQPANGPKGPQARRERGRRRGKGAGAVPQVPLMRAFDLLPKDGGRDASERRRPGKAQLALAVAALVSLAGLASVFLLTSATLADKERERDALQAEVAALNASSGKKTPVGPDQELVQESDRRTAALATALGARVAWDRLLREFSLVLPDDVWLKTMAATGSALGEPAADPAAPAPSTTFQVSGYTRDQEGVARLLARMAVLPQLESVKLLATATVELGKQEVVEFTIDATVKPSTAGGSA